MSFMLWTRKAISEHVYKKFGILMSERCVTNYLKRWGFTCQRPTAKAYSQDNVKVDRFMKEEYSCHGQKAKEEKAEIYWEMKRDRQSGEPAKRIRAQGKTTDLESGSQA